MFTKADVIHVVIGEVGFDPHQQQQRLKGEHAVLMLNWERLEEGETVLLGW